MPGSNNHTFNGAWDQKPHISGIRLGSSYSCDVPPIFLGFRIWRPQSVPFRGKLSGVSIMQRVGLADHVFLIRGRKTGPLQRCLARLDAVLGHFALRSYHIYPRGAIDPADSCGSCITCSSSVSSVTVSVYEARQPKSCHCYSCSEAPSVCPASLSSAATP